MHRFLKDNYVISNSFPQSIRRKNLERKLLLNMVILKFMVKLLSPKSETEYKSFHFDQVKIQHYNSEKYLKLMHLHLHFIHNHRVYWREILFLYVCITRFSFMEINYTCARGMITGNTLSYFVILQKSWDSINVLNYLSFFNYQINLSL